MSKVLERLNVLAICLLGGVIGIALLVQFWPRVRALAQSRMPEHVAKEEAEWTWPKTLRVCPAHAGDPVKLIKITKGGVPLEPGKYELPRIAGDDFENPHAVLRWLGDVAFTLRSEAPKNIVSVGIAVMLPVRRIDVTVFPAFATTVIHCAASTRTGVTVGVPVLDTAPCTGA